MHTLTHEKNKNVQRLLRGINCSVKNSTVWLPLCHARKCDQHVNNADSILLFGMGMTKTLCTVYNQGSCRGCA